MISSTLTVLGSLFLVLALSFEQKVKYLFYALSIALYTLAVIEHRQGFILKLVDSSRK